ncbi:hypothetical protein LTR55_012548, partial [Exophiala xenobiotica]
MPFSKLPEEKKIRRGRKNGLGSDEENINKDGLSLVQMLHRRSQKPRKLKWALPASVQRPQHHFTNPPYRWWLQLSKEILTTTASRGYGHAQ